MTGAAAGEEAGAGVTRRGMLTAGAAGLAALAAGCASPATAAGRSGTRAGSGPERTSLQVGALKSVTAAGLYIAHQRGFFAGQGLKVTIVTTEGSGPAMADLLNGRLDVNFGNYVSFIEAQAKGVASFTILDEGNNATGGQQGLLVMPRSGIRSLAGLRGKTVGVNALRNLAQVMLSSMLASRGVSPSAVKLVAVPFPDMGAALASGRVDAAWIADPYKTDAESRYGAVSVADSDQGATRDLPVSGYVATAAWAAKYPRTAAAFVRALNRGQALASTSRPSVERVMTAYTGVSPAVAARVTAGSFPSGVDRAQIQRISDLMHQYGMLARPYDVSPMIG